MENNILEEMMKLYSMQSAKVQELEKQIRDYKIINNFLRKRENKLQQIEQMFKNGLVDLTELSKLINDEVNK